MSSLAIGRLDSRARAAEKQASRDADLARLNRGEISGEQLWRENNFFASLAPQNLKIVAIGRKRISAKA